MLSMHETREERRDDVKVNSCCTYIHLLTHALVVNVTQQLKRVTRINESAKLRGDTHVDIEQKCHVLLALASTPTVVKIPIPHESDTLAP